MPGMSVIMVTPDNGEGLRGTIKHLRRQTAKDLLEIIVLTPVPGAPGIENSQRDAFARFQILETDVADSAAAARAAGVRAATASVVVFTEDHSFPEPRWAEALIRRHREDHAVVGPVVLNGNPSSLWSWVNFLIEYSEWLPSFRGGPRNHLPGHNSAYKRECLLSYGDQLDVLLESESTLHWDLQRRGHRLYLEPAARLHHFNFSRLFPSVLLRFLGGWMFGGRRCTHWPLLRRLVYAFGSPLIPFIRLLKIASNIRSSDFQGGLPGGLRPALFFLVAFDAAGECFGYLFGAGSAEEKITNIDFRRERFMNPQDHKDFVQILDSND